MMIIKWTIVLSVLFLIFIAIRYLLFKKKPKHLDDYNLKKEGEGVNHSSLRDLRHHKKAIELKLKQTERELDGFKVNHILHLILSIVTVGFWIIVWIILTIKTNRRGERLMKLIDEANIALVDIDDLIEDASENLKH